MFILLLYLTTWFVRTSYNLYIPDAKKLLENKVLQSDSIVVHVVASPARNTVRIDVTNKEIDIEDIKNFLESEQFSSIGIQDVVMLSNIICAVTKEDTGYVRMT